MFEKKRLILLDLLQTFAEMYWIMLKGIYYDCLCAWILNLWASVCVFVRTTQMTPGISSDIYCTILIGTARKQRAPWLFDELVQRDSVSVLYTTTQVDSLYCLSSRNCWISHPWFPVCVCVPQKKKRKNSWPAGIKRPGYGTMTELHRIKTGSNTPTHKDTVCTVQRGFKDASHQPACSPPLAR